MDGWGITIGVFGGLSLFLIGMGQMTDALNQAAGAGLRTVLAKLTVNRFAGVFSGAFITTLTQSSSVTTVLLVGFVSSGLMTLQQSIGVIMGANIGSTVTAQIIAFDISKYSLLLVGVGFLFSALIRNKKISQYGAMVMGLGMVFYGMSLMSESTYPLRSYPPFVDLMKTMDHPVWGILVGAGFAAVVQSSAAVTAILIVLASQGVITLEAGITIAFGANIGTCVTAALASIGKSREAMQVAAVHILFNTIGALIWIPFVDQLADFVRTISPTFPDLGPVDRLARETPRQLANAHTFFNVANTILLIGFVGPLAKWVQRLLPAPAPTEPKMIELKFIDPVYLQTPELALQQIRHELGRIGRRVVDMVETAPLIVLHGRPDRIEVITAMSQEIDQLYDQIVTFSRELGGRDISEPQVEYLHGLLEIGNYLMNTADLVERNFVSIAHQVREHSLEVSPGTRGKMQQLFQAVSVSLRKSLTALEIEDLGMATEVIEMKPTVDSLADDTFDRLSERLLADEPNRIELFRIQNEMLNHTKRIFYLAKRIAKVILLEGSKIGSPSQTETQGVA